jgi:hypothetical protein
LQIQKNSSIIEKAITSLARSKLVQAPPPQEGDVADLQELYEQIERARGETVEGMLKK